MLALFDRFFQSKRRVPDMTAWRARVDEIALDVAARYARGGVALQDKRVMTKESFDREQAEFTVALNRSIAQL